MGYVRRPEDRPKPWLARYRVPDGKHHGKSFRRKVDAERWLREEEGKSDRGEWVDPAAGKEMRDSRSRGSPAFTRSIRRRSPDKSPYCDLE